MLSWSSESKKIVIYHLKLEMKKKKKKKSLTQRSSSHKEEDENGEKTHTALQTTEKQSETDGND